jgi:hypothetical protein
VFAPVAAHLCNGVDLTELGPAVDPVGLRPGVVPLPRQEGTALHTEVLWVDRFGNAQLNVGPEEIEELGERLTVRVGDHVRQAPVVRAYGELAPGQLGLVIDSYGLLSLAFDRLPAAPEIGAHEGTEVILERADGDEPSPGVTTTVGFPR